MMIISLAGWALMFFVVDKNYRGELLPTYRVGVSRHFFVSNIELTRVV